MQMLQPPQDVVLFQHNLTANKTHFSEFLRILFLELSFLTIFKGSAKQYVGHFTIENFTAYFPVKYPTFTCFLIRLRVVSTFNILEWISIFFILRNKNLLLNKSRLTKKLLHKTVICSIAILLKWDTGFFLCVHACARACLRQMSFLPNQESLH